MDSKAEIVLNNERFKEEFNKLLKRLSDEMDIDYRAVKHFGDEWLEHAKAGFPYGEGADALQLWRRDKYVSVFKGYIEEKLGIKK